MTARYRDNVLKWTDPQWGWMIEFIDEHKYKMSVYHLLMPQTCYSGTAISEYIVIKYIYKNLSNIPTKIKDFKLICDTQINLVNLEWCKKEINLIVSLKNAFSK